eukprot:TRINITY_DN742_c0_g1_i1.p1 TRINITY_DN742_c0_g1~~TRINITY_DN742_c0_g1_i1.p1  ORF type:complete len:353 (-),score=87.98 TRINITY_DN742_c0_g1_i1:51-1040(-)
MADDYVIGASREDRMRVARANEQIAPTATAKDFLRNTKVGAVVPHNRTEIFRCKSTTSVADALETLIKQKILSMPVYDEKAKQYTSFIDMLDIVNYLVETLQEGELTSNFPEMMKTTGKLRKATCDDVAGISGRNPYYPLDENAPLMAAIQLMADNKVHRIACVDRANGEIVTLISQSQAAAIILNNINKFDVANKTLKDLNVGLKGVITIRKKNKVIEAFKLIHKSKISGVAVVNHGVLIGNISASDIKTIGATGSYVSRLFVSIKEFLKLNGSGEVAYVTPNATYHEALKKMVDLKFHRLYVCDDKKVPLGVLSYGDLLEALIQNLS